MKRLLLTLLLLSTGYVSANNDLLILKRRPQSPTVLDTTVVRISDLSSITMGSLPITGLIANYPLNFWSDPQDVKMDISGYNRTAQLITGTAHSSYMFADRFGGMYKAIQLFADSSQYIKIPNSINGLSALSISAWFHPQTCDSRRWIVGQSPIKDTVEIGFCLNSGIMRYNFSTLTNGTKIFDGNTGIPSGSWSHVVISYDGIELKAYINNKLDTTIAMSGKVVSTDSTTLGCGYFNGAYNGGNDYFDGTLDDIRYYNRALSATEINALYHEGGYTPNVALSPAVPPPAGVAPPPAVAPPAVPPPAVAVPPAATPSGPPPAAGPGNSNDGPPPAAAAPGTTPSTLPPASPPPAASQESTPNGSAELSGKASNAAQPPNSSSSSDPGNGRTSGSEK